jgi:excisionase family DNA binding protein
MGVHPKTVKDYVRHRKLPYHSRVGLRYRFDLSQVSRWLELRREGQT